MKTEVQLTSKAITIDELKNTDHVGFVINGLKGFVAYVGNGLMMISAYNGGVTCSNGLVDGGAKHKTIQYALEGEKYRIDELYVFSERSELYQWLAED